MKPKQAYRKHIYQLSIFNLPSLLKRVHSICVGLFFRFLVNSITTLRLNISARLIKNRYYFELAEMAEGLSAPSSTIAIGARGERIAFRHLRRNGYRILETNFRDAGGELDLVAIEGRTLVFVEVRTRREDSLNWPSPEESVNEQKQRRIATAAQSYLKSRARFLKKFRLRGHRFDIVGVRYKAVWGGMWWRVTISHTPWAFG